MAKYTGEVCPACNQTFTDDDDIVVCPICGAPHHRECWFKTGKCTFQDRHGSFSWKPENAGSGAQNEDFNPKSTLGEICPNCGANNPPNTLFCPTCGMPRNVSSAETQYNNNPYVKFEDPFRNVEVDGIPAKDVAEFIQGSSYQYIRKFSTKKHNGFNWAAFIFGPLWFLYRKMYKIGAAVLIIIAVLSISFSAPANSYMEEFNKAMEQAAYAETDEEFDAAAGKLDAIMASKDAALMNVYAAAMFAVALCCGIFGNTAYRKYCVKSIKESSNPETGSQNEFFKTLYIRKKGGVNMFAPLLGIAGYEVLMTVVSLVVQQITAFI